MGDRERTKMPFIEEAQAQMAIAKHALALFKKNWATPYRPGREGSNSDCGWFHHLRGGAEGIGAGMWNNFLLDYRVRRGFHDTDIAASVHQRQDAPTDAFALAEIWRQAGVTNGRQLSAASKVLFFSYPESPCIIFDKFVGIAVGFYNIDNENHFLEFRAEVLDRNDELQYPIPILNDDNGVPINEGFIERRLKDKHLFIEGQLREAKNQLLKSKTLFYDYSFWSQFRRMAVEDL